MELQKAVKALKVAGGDERVLGLFALVGDLGKEAGLAQVQELRQAVQAFRWVSLDDQVPDTNRVAPSPPVSVSPACRCLPAVHARSESHLA